MDELSLSFMTEPMSFPAADDAHSLYEKCYVTLSQGPGSQHKVNKTDLNFVSLQKRPCQGEISIY